MGPAITDRVAMEDWFLKGKDAIAEKEGSRIK
jgi:hypothetical protein